MRTSIHRPISRRGFNRGLLVAGAAGLALPAVVRHGLAAEPGGTLSVAMFKDLRTINPIMGIFGNEWRATINLYNNLTRLTAAGGVEGDLAESFSGSDDARVWTFKLRQGVQFHGGSRLSAADVVATIEKSLDPATSAPYKGELGPIEKVEAVSGQEVRFTLASAFADFPKALATATARIVSEEGIASFEKLDAQAFGTGPFRLVEFVPDDRVVMERNPDYFRGGLPYLDRVVMRVLPDTTAQQTALANREVDAIAEVDASIFKTVSEIAGVTGLRVPGGTFQNVVMLASQPPFDDPRVRRAARLALDREQMALALTEGTGSPGDDHPISAAYEFFDKATPLRKQDLAEARGLMKAAGHGEGVEVELVAANNPAVRERVAVLTQAMAAQVGLSFKIEQMDNARYGSTIWNKGIKGYVGNYGTRATEDAILTKLYHSELGIDEGRWATPESNRILDQARGSTDPARRAALYGEFQRLSRDDGPFLIWAFHDSLAAAWDYVEGYPIRAILTDLNLERTALGKDAPGRKS